MVTTIAQLDAVETALGTLITSEDSAIAQLIAAQAALITKAQAGGVDVTNEKVALDSMVADITNQVSTVNAAVAAAQAAAQ